MALGARRSDARGPGGPGATLRAPDCARPHGPRPSCARGAGGAPAVHMRSAPPSAPSPRAGAGRDLGRRLAAAPRACLGAALSAGPRCRGWTGPPGASPGPRLGAGGLGHLVWLSFPRGCKGFGGFLSLLYKRTFRVLALFRARLQGASHFLSLFLSCALPLRLSVSLPPLRLSASPPPAAGHLPVPETCFPPCGPGTVGSTEDVVPWGQGWARWTGAWCPLTPSLEDTLRGSPWTHPKWDLGGTTRPQEELWKGRDTESPTHKSAALF